MINIHRDHDPTPASDDKNKSGLSWPEAFVTVAFFCLMGWAFWLWWG